MVSTTYACIESECTRIADWHIEHKAAMSDITIAHEFSCTEHLINAVALDTTCLVEGTDLYMKKLNLEHVTEKARPWYSWIQRLWKKPLH